MVAAAPVRMRIAQANSADALFQQGSFRMGKRCYFASRPLSEEIAHAPGGKWLRSRNNQAPLRNMYHSPSADMVNFMRNALHRYLLAMREGDRPGGFL